MLPGPALAGRLRRDYRIETEMAYPGYLICMTSIADTDEGFARLTRALWEIDRDLTGRCDGSAAESRTTTICDSTDQGISSFPHFLLKKRMTSAEAHDREKRLVPLATSPGKTLGEYVFAYPPGIPLGVPGEVIDGRLLSAIRAFADGGISVKSNSGSLPEKILVLVDENS